MSELEDRVQDLLGTLINPIRPLITLEPRDQRLLALWIAKTIYMADLANSIPVVPAAAFRALYTRRTAPTAMRIWLSAYDGPNAIHYMRSAISLGSAGGGAVDGYVATVNLGHLAFQALHMFNPRVVPGRSIGPDLLVPIWPDASAPRTWPAADSDGHNAFDDATFEAFALRVGGLPNDS